MKASDFNEVVDHQIRTCEKILGVKASEYADDTDRLHNFKQAAHVQQTTPVRALSGMMSKHTVSVYDMMHEGEYSMEQWSEKITDNINYLILLKALLIEAELEKTENQPRLV